MNFHKYAILLILGLAACKNDPPAQSSSTATSNPPAKEVSKPAEPAQQTRAQVPEQKETPSAPVAEKRTSGKIDTVTVSNIEELVANAKSNSVVYLNKGKYELESDMVYYMTKDERKIIDKNVVETKSIGGQLYIAGLENFQLIGKKGAKIVSKNPDAVALYLVYANNVKISNLTVTKEVEGKVDLSYISSSRNIEIDRCKFDGGGAYGMYIYTTEGMKIKNTNISNCTKGALRMGRAKGITFINSSFSNNKLTVPVVNFYESGSDVTFRNVVIRDNIKDPKSTFTDSDRIFASVNNMILLENCVIQNNTGYKKLGLGVESVNKSQIEGLSIP